MKDATMTDDSRDSWLDSSDKPTGHDYKVLPDGRVPLWVMAVVGGESARVVTPWNKSDNPMEVSAAEIERDCDLPPGECVGREFTAAGSPEGLHDFRLVHDPRL